MQQNLLADPAEQALDALRLLPDFPPLGFREVPPVRRLGRSGRGAGGDVRGLRAEHR